MYTALYDLYTSCFPDYPIRESLFTELLAPEKAHILCKRENGQLIGFSMLHHESIALLCVDEAYRGRGVGSALLLSSEKHLADAEKITLGCGRYYLLQGVPESAVAFFEHRGYSATWSSVNMHIDLKTFSLDALTIPPCPTDIDFRLLKTDERPLLLAAVRDVQEDWLCYFEHGSEPVFIAERHGEILGFAILNPNGGRFFADGAGSMACVGVIPAARELGIGRQLVARGLEQLKNQGCGLVELLYVYLVDWYKRIGFKITAHQWMGEKIRQHLRDGSMPDSPSKSIHLPL